MPSAPSAAAEVQRAKKQPRAAPGRAVDATVTSVHPLFVIATLANGASAWFCLLWYGIFHVSSCLFLYLARSMSAESSPCAGTYTRLFREAQLLYGPAGARGRLHVSEVDDGEPGEGAQNPLERYPVGAALRAVVLEQPSSRAVRSVVQLIIVRV